MLFACIFDISPFYKVTYNAYITSKLKKELFYIDFAGIISLLSQILNKRKFNDK